MRLFFLLIILSCSDIFIPDDEQYRSIQLNGDGWVQIENQYDCENGLRVIDNNFSLEIFFSGEASDNSSTIFSIIGKKTENYDDNNCNGIFDEGDVDQNQDGQLDNINDDNYIVLMVATNPPSPNNLFFYVNNNYTLNDTLNIDFTNPNEFHLLQILSYQGTIEFYLDNVLVHYEEADIMLQETDLIIGAKTNSSTSENGFYGYIDEIRLWNNNLSDNLREMHYNDPNKLVETLQDSTICDLRGLWRFNYDTPSLNIIDETCEQINSLYDNPCEINLCEYPLDAIIRGDVKYTRLSF